MQRFRELILHSLCALTLISRDVNYWLLCPPGSKGWTGNNDEILTTKIICGIPKRCRSMGVVF